MNIAILGFGVVGKGISEILNKQNNTKINISKILERNAKNKNFVKANAGLLKKISKTAPSKIFTDDIKEIIKTKSIDTVVECLGGDDVPFSFCKSALLAKKNVVTSNKKMLAKYYKELIALAKKKKVSILFEASVCGGIPFINTLSNISNASKINSISGIMNGSSNYILYKMFEEDLSFEEALREAKSLGYAEYDPSDDIDGIDTKNKILISSNLAFNTSNNIKDVISLGIRNINVNDIAFCKKYNVTCKLIARAELIKDKKTFLIVDVLPTFIAKNDPFAKIDLNNNMISIDSYGLGRVNLSGAGAGALPTGHAVVSDLLLLNNKSEYKAQILKNIKINNESNICDIYFRNDASVDKNKLKEIIEDFSNENVSISKFSLNSADIERLKLERSNIEDIVIYESENANTYLIFGLNIVQIEKLSKEFKKAFIARI